MKSKNKKLIIQSALVAVLVLAFGVRAASAQTYSSMNDCEGSLSESECCALPISNFSASGQASKVAACSNTSPAGTNLLGGSPCVSNQVCASGVCNNGACTTPGTSPATNLNGNSSSGSNPICDPNGYTMQNGLCIPNSPFSGGLASQGTLSGLITTILNIVLALSGIIAVIFIIIGGFQYITAGGNSEQAEKGRVALTNAIIGLLIVILAFTIVKVVTNTLTTTSPLGYNQSLKI